jgi:hypothetical protein
VFQGRGFESLPDAQTFSFQWLVRITLKSILNGIKHTI